MGLFRKEKPPKKVEPPKRKTLDVLILSLEWTGWKKYGSHVFVDGKIRHSDGYSIDLMYEKDNKSELGVLYREGLGDHIKELMFKLYQGLHHAQQEECEVRLNVEDYGQIRKHSEDEFTKSYFRVYSFEKCARLIPKKEPGVKNKK